MPLLFLRTDDIYWIITFNEAICFLKINRPVQNTIYGNRVAKSGLANTPPGNLPFCSVLASTNQGVNDY